MQYRTLGPVEIIRDDEVVDLGPRQQRALLALLLINANEVVSTDRIIEELWGDRAGRGREKTLWVVVSRLRAVLEPGREKRSEGLILLSRPPGYVLSVDPDDIDANRFEALATEGRGLLEPDPAAASLVLSEALGLWRGHALEEFMYEAFAEAEVARLEELRLGTLEDRIDADLRTGRARELVGELESLARQHPARERMTGHLMLALHLSGRQGDALRAFGTYRSYLAEELGLDPSGEISHLEERIVLDDPELRDVGAVRGLAGRPEPGLSVRGYELREQIGSGAMGNVYRAFQPAVSREVAIKVIRRELANDPSFIRHFEAEAQLIARLEHPQIVPVFDYWREPDSAYLVTRRFERGSLRDLVEAGGLTAEAATNVVTQVGAALAAAHRQGVAHGDLKPENVLIDGDGNAYLADFGMSWSNGATTDFVAPEQLSSAEAAPQSDVFSLGRLAEYAYRGTGIEVSDVVARATATSPADRFPDVDSFVEAVVASAGAEVTAVAEAVINPYRGLHAFDESDADRFFGRERLVERLLARLDHRGPQGRFVAVVGPSGSGKSSVVRAGVVPALRAGAVPGSNRWFIAKMIPGRHPFEALEDALRAVAVDPPPDLLERLSTDGIAAAVGDLIADQSAQIVLVVDQLEELFSLAAPHEADRFMSAVADTAADRHSSVRVIATLRADFYDHPLRHGAFGELVRLGTEVITPMTPDELERAITGPAAEVGVSFESGLVATVANDMAGQSTALPLLQYALTELFERRSGSTVTTSVYQQLGGVAGALARRADAIYEGLGPDDQRSVRDVFLRLVTLNEGGADTRRRALVTELNDAGRTDTGSVLDSFGRHRLLSFDRDTVTRGPTVEIAHEALLTEWSRLRRWIEDARTDIQAERQLAAAVDEWRESGQESDFLLTGARLARYDGWSEAPPVPLTADERAYLVASEAADAEELETERRRLRRLRRLVIGFGVGLVLALIAGATAFQQQRRADDEAQRANDEARAAELASLISTSAAVRIDDPELGLLLALEAHERAPGFDAEQAVLSVLSGSTLAARIANRAPLVNDCGGEGIIAGGFPDALEMATVDGRMLGRDLVTNDVIDMGSPPDPCAIGFRDDVNATAARADGSTIWLGPNWEIELNFDQRTFPIGETVDRMAVVSQGRARDTVRVFDRSSGDQIGDPIEGGFLAAQVVDPARGLIVVAFFDSEIGADGTLVVIDAATGTETARLVVPQPPSAVAFDPATGHLVAALWGGNVITVDVATGALIEEVMTQQALDYRAIGFRPDGTVILVSRDAIKLLDRATEDTEVVAELQNVDQSIVRADGLIVTVTERGTRSVYDLDANAIIERAWPADAFGSVATLDGRAAVVSRDDELEIIDLASGRRQDVDLRLPDGTSFVPRLMYAESDGIWAMSGDLVLGRWEGGELVDSLDVGSDESVDWLPFDGNMLSGTRLGDRLAVLGARWLADGGHPRAATEATLVDLSQGRPSIVFRVDVGGFWAIPTIDGGMMVADRSGALRTYDAGGELVGEVIQTGAFPYAMAMSADGTTLALGTLGAGEGFVDGAILVLDVPSGEVHAVPGEGLVSTIGVTDDGSRLVLAMWDGSVRVYDVDERNVPTIVYNGTGALTSPPGWYDAEAGTMWIHSDGKLLEIPLEPEAWVAKACELVDRDLTQEEWDRFVPGDEPLGSACESR